MLIQEEKIKGIKAPPPHKRILKLAVSPDTIGSKNISVGLSIIPPGSSSNPHIHKGEEEVFYVVSGKGKVMLNRKKFNIKPGTFIYIKPGTLHQLINTGKEVLKVHWAESPPHVTSTLYKVHKIPKPKTTSKKSAKKKR
jgi:mannose-6-phosphate isomerase-like protein (cupin superfamily)